MNWLRRNMVGRYGRIDQLNIFLFVLLIAFAVIRLVINLIARFTMSGLFMAPGWTVVSIIYSVLFGLQTAVIIVLVLRFFSRNIEARARENQKFVNKLYNFKDRSEFSKMKKNAKKDGKTLYKCPVCRKVIRVPLGRGKIEITCPNCKHKFVKKT